MSRGALRSQLSSTSVAPAPVSGVPFGTHAESQVVLRLFRAGGTRIAAIAGVVPVQLLVIRAAAAGVPVRVITARAAVWSPVLRFGDVKAAPPGTPLPPPAGPTLVVDDRPTEASGLGEAGPWQCRIDIRSPWTPADVAGLVHADLLVTGMVSMALAAAVSRSYGLTSTTTAELAGLRPDTVALVARGTARMITLDPTPDESLVLRGG